MSLQVSDPSTRLPDTETGDSIPDDSLNNFTEGCPLNESATRNSVVSKKTSSSSSVSASTSS
eukprot:Gb_20839 [translate_table: standard]